MRTRHLASAFLAVSGFAVLAASCAQSRESPKIETKNDDGDYGSDPDVGGSTGSDPGEPAWSWSPPSCDPSKGDGDSDPEPDPGDVGGAPVAGYSRSPPVSSPAVMPLAPCEHQCQQDYEDMAANCGSLESAVDRKKCADSAYAANKTCRETCRKGSDDDCLKHCKEMCYDQMVQCKDRCKKKKVKDRPSCYDQCNQAHGRCIHDCEKNCT